MATGLKESIVPHLECGICLGQLEDPTFMSCMHTFCSKCISGLRLRYSRDNPDYQRCPICREKTELCSRPRAKKLKPNLLAKYMLEAVASHDKVNATKDFCKSHPSIERNHFCEKCELAVCSECAVKEHCDHSRRIKSLEQLSEGRTESLVRLLRDAAKWTEDHNAYLKDLTARRQTGNDKLDSLVSEVGTAYGRHLKAMHAKLCGAKENLMNTIEARRGAFNDEMDERIERETRIISRVTESTADAEGLLDRRPSTLMSLYKDYSGVLKYGLKTKIPSQLEERRLLNGVKNLRFEGLHVPASLVLLIGILHPHPKAAKEPGNLTLKQGKRLRIKRPLQRLFLTKQFEIEGELKTVATNGRGHVIAGYRKGRMEILHPDGTRHDISADMPARDVAMLADGRLVTLTRKNTICLYQEDGSLEKDVKFDIEGDCFVDAIAVDKDDNILLLFPEEAFILIFLPTGGSPASRLDLACCIPSGISEMLASGEIMIVADDAVLTVDTEGAVDQHMTLARTERASCDQAGNIWILSHDKMRDVTPQLFLDKYDGESGDHVASLLIPTTQTRKGFEPWGVATSENSFAALVSHGKIAFFSLSKANGSFVANEP